MGTYPERIQKALDRARGHIQRNEPQNAIPDLEKVVAKLPKSADGWFLLGEVKGMLGEHREAEGHLRKALSLMPKNVNIQFSLAQTLTKRERFAEAIPLYSKAILSTHTPPASAIHNLGSCHLQLGQYEDAVGVFTALLRHVDTADIRALLGMAYQGLNDYGRALEEYEKAASNGLSGYTLSLNRGVCAFMGNDFEAAERYAEAALEASPGDEVATENLASARLGAGDVREAIDTFKRSQSHRASLGRLLAMNYSAEQALQAIFDAHVEVGKAYPRPLPALDREECAPSEKIRLGFVSGDLRNHPVAYFLEGLLDALDRDVFDIYVFATAPDRDEITDRFMAQDVIWRDISAMSDEAAAMAVRSDKLAIAFDISGNTATGKPGMFAMRVAPVQASYLGYGATSGLAEMDYFVTDDVLDPEGHPGALYTETLVRVGDVFATYTPPRVTAEIGPMPMEKRGYPTFGSFAQPCKIDDSTLALWASAMQAVPGSHLVIMAKGLDRASAQERMRGKLAARGVDAARIHFKGAASMSEYLAAHNDIDLILDTVPWNGHTTTMHALWMGVPTVSVRGHHHVARFGEMVLRAMGLTEFLAPDGAAFGATVAAMIANRAGLDDLRRNGRNRLLASPLCDHGALASRFKAICLSWVGSN